MELEVRHGGQGPDDSGVAMFCLQVRFCLNDDHVDHHSNKNKLCISQKFRRVLLSLHDFSKRDISTDDFLLQDFYLRPTVTDKRTFYVENVRFIHFLNLCCFLCILPLLRLYKHQKFIDAKCQYWQYFQFFAVNESNKTAV